MQEGLRDSRKDQTGGDNVCVAHAETNPKKKLACVAHAKAKQSCMEPAWPTQGGNGWDTGLRGSRKDQRMKNELA